MFCIQLLKLYNYSSISFAVFLDASTQLYERFCPSVSWSICWFVHLSICRLIHLLVHPSYGPSLRNTFVSNTQKCVIFVSKVDGMSRGGRWRKEGWGVGEEWQGAGKGVKGVEMHLTFSVTELVFWRACFNKTLTYLSSFALSFFTIQVSWMVTFVPSKSFLSSKLKLTYFI